MPCATGHLSSFAGLAATEWKFCPFYPFCVPDSGKFVGFVATEWKNISISSFCVQANFSLSRRHQAELVGAGPERKLAAR